VPSGTIVSGSHQVEAEAETYPRGLTLVGVPLGTIVSGSHQVEAEAETYPRGLTLVGVPLGTWETSPLECTKLLLHALTWSMHSKGQETSPTVSGINALLPRLKPGRRKPNTCSRTVEATL